MFAITPISLEIFRHLFVAVAEEMGVTLRQASFSPNIKERLDFSCAIFDDQARMIAQAAHIPVHLGSMPASVAAALVSYPVLAPGDVIALNDPYHGGTHLPDITMVTPVFAGERVAFFAASRAHHADVGGMAPGSLPLSTELYQEGLILPPVKLTPEVRTLIAANSRTPDERRGDIDAQLAAQRLGAQRLGDLISAHGLEAVHAHATALMEYAEKLMAAAIRVIPDGVYVAEDYLEGDGQSEGDILIRVTVTVAGERMVVDFTGSAPQVAGNMNAVAAIAQSAVWYCARLILATDAPVNHGAFAPVTVIAPPQSVVNAAFPAAVAVGNTETSSRIVDVVLRALAHALPERIPAASQGTMNNVTFGGVAGGQPFIYYETLAGGHGAGPAGDGLSGRHSHMTNTLNTPVEALEYAAPVRVMEYALRDGSGGAGRYRGGEGVRRAYTFLAPATVTVNTERRARGPYGLRGGQPGSPGCNSVLRGGERSTIGAKQAVRLTPGDQLILETPGGGGWGEESGNPSTGG
jgi:N-methylhydantoinase B